MWVELTHVSSKAFPNYDYSVIYTFDILLTVDATMNDSWSDL